MAKKIQGINVELQFGVKGRGKAQKEIKSINKVQKAHYEDLKKISKHEVKKKEKWLKTENKHLSKIKKIKKTTANAMVKSNNKAETSLNKQLRIHEKIYNTARKTAKAAARYGGRKVLGGLKKTGKGIAFASLGAVAGKLISRGVRSYKNVMDLVQEAPEIAGDYGELISKAKAIFSQKASKGDSASEVAKAERNDAIYKTGLKKLLDEREGRKGGTGLGRVQLTGIVADLGAQLKGFGYEGQELMHMVDEYLKASVDIASLYNLDVKTVASIMTKVRVGETEQAKERLGILVQEKIILGKLKYNEEIIDKFIRKPHGVNSFAELSDKVKNEVKSEARIWLFKDIALNKVGAKGDYARTKLSFGNVSKELRSLVIDYKNEIGKIVQDKSVAQIEETIKLYRKQVDMFRAAKTDEEKKALYEKYGDPIEKLQKIEYDAMRRDVTSMPIAARVTADIMTGIDKTTNTISAGLNVALPKILDFIDYMMTFFSEGKNFFSEIKTILSTKLDEIVKNSKVGGVLGKILGN